MLESATFCKQTQRIRRCLPNRRESAKSRTAAPESMQPSFLHVRLCTSNKLHSIWAAAWEEEGRELLHGQSCCCFPIKLTFPSISMLLLPATRSTAHFLRNSTRLPVGKFKIVKSAGGRANLVTKGTRELSFNLFQANLHQIACHWHAEFGAIVC